MGRDDGTILDSGGFPKFQSTRPHGARHNMQGVDSPPKKVSIHAPAWGATKIMIFS